MRSVVGVALAGVLLAGCASFERVERAARNVERAAQEAGETARALRETPQPPPRPTIRYVDATWVETRAIDLRKPEIPEALRCNITINAEKVPLDVLEFSQVITRWCGVPARVTNDALQAIQMQGRLVSTTGTAVPGTPGVPGTTPGGLPGLPALPGTPGVGTSGVPGVTGTATTGTPGVGVGGRAAMIAFAYSGELVPLLEMATQRLGISWKFVDGSIRLYYLDTRVFRFASLALTTDFSASVQSGVTAAAGSSGSSSGSSTGSSSGGVSGTSGSQQSAAVSMKSSKWDDVRGALASMLTPGMGRMAVSPSSGSITVTDTYEVLNRVEAYLDAENRSLTKQVLFNVKVLSVTINSADSAGVDWNLVYKHLSGQYGLGLKNVTGKDPGAVSMSAGVVTGATGAAGQFAGTTAVISALSQQGRVSTLRSPSVTTLNMNSVPLQIGSQVTYVASSATTVTANVGSSTSLTPGTVSTGFNMILLPYVMPDNVMLLQSSINISALTRIRSVTSSSTTIEVPEVASQIFSQTARLRAGETLILSGFEQFSESSNKAGVGTPNNILLGGAVSGSNVRDVIVILITPVVLE